MGMQSTKSLSDGYGIKVDLNKRVDWIHLAQDWDQTWVLKDKVMNLRGPRDTYR